jgi:hypothetical protein
MMPDYIPIPVFVYSHSATGGCAITGGYVYRGSHFPNLLGHYIFTDYCNDSIWTLYNQSGNWLLTRQGHYPDNNFSTFGEDANGELYVAGHTSGTIYRLIETTSGLGDQSLSGNIKIYPDPFEQSVNIELGSDNASGAHLTIFDLQGRPLFSKNISNSNTTLHLNFLPQGIYFVRLEIKGQTVFRKIMKLSP